MFLIGVRILVFGNPLVQQDSIALAILPELRKRFPKIEFVEFDAAEDLETEGNQPVILDAVDGIKQCELIADLEILVPASRNLSMHDFDLGKTLLLLKKIGKINGATIIGIPQNYNEKKALIEVTVLLEKMRRNTK